MASSGILPNYVEPCISERHNSLESIWLQESDFGECYTSPPDSLLYPRLVPVYNGKVLDIESEFLHASLSGISIKHYYGKCTKPKEEVLYGDDTELYDNELVDDDPEVLESPTRKEPSVTSTENGESGENGERGESESSIYQTPWRNVGEPPCALPKINYRNSFWNIHRPEMCKLTWGQNYVSASTVTEHLHQHLIYHGPLCKGFHNKRDRNLMLNKELDEYVRLKVILCPKEIPPDEPLYNFKDPLRIETGTFHPSCKVRMPPQITEAIEENERFMNLCDDEEIAGKRIHRSEEEFCVTIGKHVRKLQILPAVASSKELSSLQPRFSYGEGPEGDHETFQFDWILYSGEEYLTDYSDATEISKTSTTTESEFQNKFEDKLDEFCRGVGKVDYSDIQSKPDF